MNAPQQCRRIARLISRRGILLLVAGIVLLIHHDQAQISEGQEHCAARAHQEPPLALFVGHSAIRRGALTGGESAVIHFQPVSEKPAKPDDELGGQGNLRDEEQGVLPPLQDLVDQVGIHLRLAASGHALQQHHPLLLQSMGNAGPGHLLRRAEGRQGDVLAVLRPGQPRVLLELEHQSLFHQPGKQGGRDAVLTGQLGQGDARPMRSLGQQPHHGHGLFGRTRIEVIQLI